MYVLGRGETTNLHGQIHHFKYGSLGEPENITLQSVAFLVQCLQGIMCLIKKAFFDKGEKFFVSF